VLREQIAVMGAEPAEARRLAASDGSVADALRSSRARCEPEACGLLKRLGS
jgi:hypothetical protein